MENTFNKNTYPNLFNDPSFGSIYHSARNAYVQSNKEISPVQNIRYPAYAATLEDGRLVTDYRPQCTKNIKPGKQFHTKLWLIHHSEEIMDESRRRQVEWSGASLGMANTVPPPAAIVHSTPFYSETIPTYMHNGLGIERANSKAPELFGTFRYEATMSEIQNNRKNIGITNVYEGGRNSRRF